MEFTITNFDLLGTTVEMDHIEVVPHMERWPSFHNGVAAGLRLSIPNDDKDSVACDSHGMTIEIRGLSIGIWDLRVKTQINHYKYC